MKIEIGLSGPWRQVARVKLEHSELEELYAEYKQGTVEESDMLDPGTSLQNEITDYYGLDRHGIEIEYISVDGVELDEDVYSGKIQFAECGSVDDNDLAAGDVYCLTQIECDGEGPLEIEVDAEQFDISKLVIQYNSYSFLQLWDVLGDIVCGATYDGEEFLVGVEGEGAAPERSIAAFYRYDEPGAIGGKFTSITQIHNLSDGVEQWDWSGLKKIMGRRPGESAEDSVRDNLPPLKIEIEIKGMGMEISYVELENSELRELYEAYKSGTVDDCELLDPWGEFENSAIEGYGVEFGDLEIGDVSINGVTLDEDFDRSSFSLERIKVINTEEPSGKAYLLCHGEREISGVMTLETRDKEFDRSKLCLQYLVYQLEGNHDMNGGIICSASYDGEQFEVEFENSGGDDHKILVLNSFAGSEIYKSEDGDEQWDWSGCREILGEELEGSSEEPT